MADACTVFNISGLLPSVIDFSINNNFSGIKKAFLHSFIIIEWSEKRRRHSSNSDKQTKRNCNREPPCNGHQKQLPEV